MKIIPIALIASVLLQSQLKAQPVKYLLHDNWKAKRASDLTLDGSVITGPITSPKDG